MGLYIMEKAVTYILFCLMLLTTTSCKGLKTGVGIRGILCGDDLMTLDGDTFRIQERIGDSLLIVYHYPEDNDHHYLIKQERNGFYYIQQEGNSISAIDNTQEYVCVNDKMVYTRLSQFRSEAARRIAEQADRTSDEIERLQQMYEQSGRDYALVLIDADNFKTINDTYGHTIGDQILIKIADAMKKTFRTIDAPCRIGGDEFAVIMTDVKSQMADVVQARLIQLQRFIALENDDLPKVTVSMGVTFSDRKNPTGTIFEDADDALYRIKQTGRNGFGFYRKNDK